MRMKLGLGLYRHQLDADHYRFARQCGCTHVVVHLVDYFRSSRSNRPGDQPVGDDAGWGLAGDPDRLWGFEELAAIRKEINAAGLELEAIENFDPAHWHDVLLDGPKKRSQLENLKTTIRNVGKAGIPILGYNFSIAGVAEPSSTGQPASLAQRMVWSTYSTPRLAPSGSESGKAASI